MLFDTPQGAYSQSSSPDALRDSYLFAEPNKQSVAFQTKRALQQGPDHHHITYPHAIQLDSQKSIQYKKMIEGAVHGVQTTPYPIDLASGSLFD